MIFQRDMNVVVVVVLPWLGDSNLFTLSVYFTCAIYCLLFLIIAFWRTYGCLYGRVLLGKLLTH